MTAPETTKLEGVHSAMIIGRPAPGVVILIIEGADIGELGERPFLELAPDLQSIEKLQLFVDARAASGPSIEVSAQWASWLKANYSRLAHVTMLPGSRFVHITAEFVRHFAGLGDTMRILMDPAAFDDAVRTAGTVAGLLAGSRSFPVWEQLYQNEGIEKLPWYCAELDPDLDRALARYGVTGGRIADLGTGPGTQAIELAARGYDATGTDVARAALDYAAERAKERGVSPRFLVDDVLATKLEGPFDAIFDRGCFHVLSPEDRDRYVDNAHRLLAPRAYLFLKTFSHHQPGGQGPHRFSPDDIRRIFAAGDRFEVLESIETVYQGQLDPFPKALFTVMRRR
jgi:SAM-dependent methyltransferase